MNGCHLCALSRAYRGSKTHRGAELDLAKLNPCLHVFRVDCQSRRPDRNDFWCWRWNFFQEDLQFCKGFRIERWVHFLKGNSCENGENAIREVTYIYPGSCKLALQLGFLTELAPEVYFASFWLVLSSSETMIRDFELYSTSILESHGAA